MKKELKNRVKNGVHILKEDIAKLESNAIRILAGYDYPKLTFLVLCIIAAYFLFSNNSVQAFMSSLNNYRYLGVFIAGMFFTFGFTSPFAAGFFITLNPSSVYSAAIIGGAGAVLGDLLIFKLIRFSFIEEFNKLKREKPIQMARKMIESHFGHKVRAYLIYAFAGILIASPLPDEAGVIMLAGLTHIKAKTLVIISFIMNTLGILVLCLI